MGLTLIDPMKYAQPSDAMRRARDERTSSPQTERTLATPTCLRPLTDGECECAPACGFWTDPTSVLPGAAACLRLCRRAGFSCDQPHTSVPHPPPMSEAIKELKKLKVQDLRDRLSAKGLDTAGTKEVLLERLSAAMQEEETTAAAEASPAASASSPSAASASTEVAAPAAVESSSSSSSSSSAPVATKVVLPALLQNADAETKLRAERGRGRQPAPRLSSCLFGTPRPPLRFHPMLFFLRHSCSLWRRGCPV